MSRLLSSPLTLLLFSLSILSTSSIYSSRDSVEILDSKTFRQKVIVRTSFVSRFSILPITIHRKAKVYGLSSSTRHGAAIVSNLLRNGKKPQKLSRASYTSLQVPSPEFFESHFPHSLAFQSTVISTKTLPRHTK